MKRLLLSLSILSAVGCATNAPQYNASHIIYNGHVLTMNATQADHANGVVVIQDDRIIAVGDDALLSQYRAPQMTDAKDGIVLPGLINAHNHLPMIAFRGLGEQGIENRLFAYFFPLEKEKLSRELIYHATQLGAIDLAESGITTFADMYYFGDEMAKATKSVGLRAVIGETVIKYPNVVSDQPYGGLAYAEEFVKAYQNDPLITPAFAPHAVYTVSKEVLSQINQKAEQYDVPVLMHVSEFSNEAERIENNANKLSPIAWLHQAGLLNDRWLLAHAIHIDDNDIRILKKTDAKVSYNPMANAKGATGIAPAWQMYRENIDMGLGTDGPMSSNQVDIWRTLSYAANMQRLKYQDRTIMIPQQVLELATIGGAKALNLEDEIGSLEVGKKADVIVVETQSTNMRPNYDPYATLVYQANPSNVVMTMVNGKVVMKDRQIQTLDKTQVYEKIDLIERDIYDFAQALAKEAIVSPSVMK